MNCQQSRSRTPGSDELKIGALLNGTYRILSMIGQGGMGVVYCAMHVFLNRTVAVKVLHPNYMNSRKDFLRFQREAILAASLSHRNIVTVYDFGVAEQVAYMVMDYLDGKTISEAFNHEPINIISFFDIFIQACDALYHAHARGVIHRDLNCNNLMLLNTHEKHVELRIIDFGLAKTFLAADRLSQDLTDSGMVAGCPYFMSPEQIRGEEVDPRSDIYSLGCVMYRCLSGEYPLKGNSAMETMCKHLTDSPRTISQTDGTLLVPPRVEQLVMSCMEKSPNSRPQSMAEIAADLERQRLQWSDTGIISQKPIPLTTIRNSVTCHIQSNSSHCTC